MKVVRKSLAGVGLGIALSAAAVVGSGLIKDVQFARAQQQVEATRQQIANIQDMAAVYKAVGKTVEPSVVSIEVRKTAENPNVRRFLQQDRNGDGVPDAPLEQGTGSGVIIDTDGKSAYIVTNNHVAGGAIEMTVLLHDGREIQNAKVVGIDPKTDLAVIKIEAERLIPAKWGDSDALQKGDVIMAFGSPFGYVGSMTHGIVSALHRQTLMSERGDNRFKYENFIQVDAPINPGNSGGPLVNLKGEVVGINTAIATESGGFQGLGFAIPAEQAKFVVNAIREKGRVVRGFLGVGIGDIAKQLEFGESLGFTDRSGIIVSQIYNKTPAAGKLQPGDVITTLNEKKVENVQELRNQIAAMAPGTDVKIGVFRSGKPTDVMLTLGVQPDDTTPIAAAPPENRTPSGPSSAENLGLRLGSLNDETALTMNLPAGAGGAVVMASRPGTLAYVSGLRNGDLITQIDDTPIKSADDAREVFSKKDPVKGMKIYVTNKDGSSLLFLRAER